MSLQQVSSHLAVWDLNNKTGCISLQTTKLTVLSPLAAEDFQSLLAVLQGTPPVMWDDVSRRLQSGNLATSCTAAGLPCACTGTGPDCTALGLPGQPTHCSGAGPDCTSPGQPGCTGPGHPGQPNCTGTGPNCTVAGAPDRPCAGAGKPDAPCTVPGKPGNDCTAHKPSCPGVPA